MSNTSHLKRRAGRCRPALEGLDARLVLSTTPWPSTILSVSASPVSAYDGVAPAELGPSLTVVDVFPAAGSVSREAPGSFSVTFDRPIDPFSLAYYDDVRLDRLDGEVWLRAYDDFAVPMVEIDPSETRLSFTLAGPLGPGTYRIVLPAGSFLSGADGSFLADVTDDQVLGEFQVETPGVGLDEASDVGEVGDAPTLITGSLDFVVDPRQVRLYRFTLPEGSRWRLGAEVSAQREGSALASALALFDAQGRLIATANQGRPDAPNDPYLFAGLEPGTYYLGLSGRANVPGAPGGYDPATMTPGDPSDPERGGTFRLNLVADPANEPVKVLGLNLNWADPSQVSPTGLSLTFSGALSIQSFIATGPGEAVEVVGEDGMAWKLTAVGLNEPGARYYFLLHEPLPAGRYLVRLSAGSGLTDLSGLVPFAPNEPAGVLGRFEVQDRPVGPRDRNDLGPLYEEVREGISFRDVIPPGRAVTYRFVVLTEGLYRIGAPDATGTVGLNVLGVQGMSRLEFTATNSAFVNLRSGVYLLQLVNPGGRPIRLTWQIQLGTLWDSLLENGLGQSPALSLRLVSPSGAGFSSAPPEPTLGPTSASLDHSPTLGLSGPIGPFGTAYPNPGQPGVFNEDSSLTPSSSGSGLSLTFAGNPVGLPVAQANHVAVVGPGSLAMASNTPGLLDGVGYGQSVPETSSMAFESSDATDTPRGPAPPRNSPRTPDEDDDSGTEEQEQVEAAVEGEKVVEIEAPVNGAMVVVPEPERPKGDAVAIAAADWLTNLGSLAARLTSFGFDEAPEAPPAEPGTPPIVMGDDTRLPASTGRVERANFSTPLVVGVGAVIAMRYSEAVRHWVRRKRLGPVAATKANSGGHFRGPHVRV